MTDVCCLSVCLSVRLTASPNSLIFIGRPNSSKSAGINEAMNGVLNCHKFSLFCLANTFKCKTKAKTKNKFQLSLYLTIRHQKNESKKGFYCFQNEHFATCI